MLRFCMGIQHNWLLWDMALLKRRLRVYLLPVPPTPQGLDMVMYSNELKVENPVGVLTL